MGRQTLEKICDGTYRYPVKGKKKVKLTNIPVVFVLGNRPIWKVYSESKDRPDKPDEYITERFREIQLDLLSRPYKRTRMKCYDKLMDDVKKQICIRQTLNDDL